MKNTSVNYILALNEIKSLELKYNNYKFIIDKFKIHFYQELFSNSHDYIEELKKQKNLGKYDHLFIRFLEINLLIHENETDQANKVITEMKNEFDFNSNKILNLLYDLLQSFILTSVKKKNEFLKLISKIEDEIENLINLEEYPTNFINEVLATLSYIKGINDRTNQWFVESISHFKTCITIRKTVNEIENGLPYYKIAQSFSALGNYSQSIENFESALSIFQNQSIGGQLIKNNKKIFGAYNNIGLNFWKLGKLNDALLYYSKALEISQTLNDRLRGIILANLGLILWEKGELDNSLVYNNKSLEILENSNDKPLLSTVLNNIANIYQNKGEINLALNYYEHALKISEDISNKSQYASILNNIAELFQSKGNFQKSYQIYNESLKIFTELQSKSEISFILYNLINISLYLQNKQEAENFLAELKKIKDNNNEEIKAINQTFTLSSANIKKYNKRFVDLGEAQGLYNEIIEDDIVKHEYTAEAILQMCELLLLELKFSGEENLLGELTNLINKLYDIAKNQNSFLLLCHSYILLSKISILNFDPENIDRANDLLIHNRKIAEERGYKNLANRLTFEIESQQRAIDKINSTDKTKITFDLLLELTEIESYVSKIIKNKIISLPIDVEDEIPRLILLIARSGISFYSYSFDNFETYDSSLIGGFLSALNTFFQETFETNTPIERITQKDYTILFRSIDQVTFCYIFTGQTLKAMTKFEKLISVLLASEEFQSKSKESLKTGRSLHNDPWLKEQISEIFEKK